MNAIAKTKAAPTPAIQQESSTRAPAVMAALHEKFGSIIALARRRSSESCKDWLRKNPPPELPTPGRFTSDPETITRLRNREIERAHDLVRILPAPELLLKQSKDLHKSAFTPATDKEIRLCVAALIDAIPHAANTAGLGFIDSLVFAIQRSDDEFPEWDSCGFSLPVLFLTVQRLASSSKFCPAICEFLDEARKTREMFHAAWRATDQLIEVYHAVEYLIDEIDNPIADNTGGDIPE